MNEEYWRNLSKFFFTREKLGGEKKRKTPNTHQQGQLEILYLDCSSGGQIGSLLEMGPSTRHDGSLQKWDF